MSDTRCPVEPRDAIEDCLYGNGLVLESYDHRRPVIDSPLSELVAALAPFIAARDRKNRERGWNEGLVRGMLFEQNFANDLPEVDTTNPYAQEAPDAR